MDKIIGLGEKYPVDDVINAFKSAASGISLIFKDGSKRDYYDLGGTQPVSPKLSKLVFNVRDGFFRRGVFYKSLSTLDLKEGIESLQYYCEAFCWPIKQERLEEYLGNVVGCLKASKEKKL